MPFLDGLSFQLYSARPIDSLSGLIEGLHKQGYSYVEPFGALLTDAASLQRELNARGMSAPSSHVALDSLRNDFDNTLASIKTLGIDLVIAPYLMSDERPVDVAGWRALGQTLQDIATRLKQEGMRFAWHNHDFEFFHVGEKMPMDLLLEESPDVLWEIDIAWIVRANEDPVKWLRRYKGRIPAVHLKDIAPEGEAVDEDGWADVGHGKLDWSTLVPAIQEAGATLFVVEHDKPSDAGRFARRSRETVASWDEAAS